MPELCPDCQRPKAKTAGDVARGDCPKWWAINDAMAEHDCAKYTEQEAPKALVVEVSYRSSPPVIPLDQIQWQDVSENEGQRTRLLAHIAIGNLSMHLEARQMTEYGNGFPTTIEHSEDHDMMANMSETNFSTLEMDGKEYFVFALPYGV